MMARLLVVSSDLTILRLTYRVTEAHSHEAIFALSGKRGLSLALAHPFDLIIIDAELPAFGGFGLAGALCSQVFSPPTRLLGIARDDGVRAHLQRIGLIEVLLQPLTPKAFARALDGLLARRAPASHAGLRVTFVDGDR